MQITDDLSDVCLEDYYEKEFFDNTYGGLNQEKGQRTAYEKFAYRLQEIEKLKPEKGTILDVGCSFGYFLDAARSRGWKPVGVEIGEYAARFAQENEPKFPSGQKGFWARYRWRVDRGTPKALAAARVLSPFTLAS